MEHQVPLVTVDAHFDAVEGLQRRDDFYRS